MEKKRAAPPVADINVTPMVDVMLVLLIIFMVITPMLTKGQSVDKVKTKNPVTMQAADKEDAILISVTRNGSVFLSPGNLLQFALRSLVPLVEYTTQDQGCIAVVVQASD